jgi:phage shock protein A
MAGESDVLTTRLEEIETDLASCSENVDRIEKEIKALMETLEQQKSLQAQMQATLQQIQTTLKSRVRVL